MLAYSDPMHSPQTRANLLRCRAVVEDADVSDELQQLARNLLDHLLEMHDAQRLRIPVFLLALDSLELVPGLEECVAKLREAAALEQASKE